MRAVSLILSVVTYTSCPKTVEGNGGDISGHNMHVNGGEINLWLLFGVLLLLLIVICLLYTSDAADE